MFAVSGPLVEAVSPGAKGLKTHLGLFFLLIRLARANLLFYSDGFLTLCCKIQPILEDYLHSSRNYDVECRVRSIAAPRVYSPDWTDKSQGEGGVEVALDLG